MTTSVAPIKPKRFRIREGVKKSMRHSISGKVFRAGVIPLGRASPASSRVEQARVISNIQSEKPFLAPSNSISGVYCSDSRLRPGPGSGHRGKIRPSSG
jgi:hypothetical protein